MQSACICLSNNGKIVSIQCMWGLYNTIQTLKYFSYNSLLCSGFSRYSKVLWSTRKHVKNKQTVAGIFRQTVSKHPKKVAFIFEQKTWTFQDVEEYSNRIANYFKSQGYKKGDVVALFLESCPEFVCMWLGLSKLGVITALINTNLRLDSLFHCISVATVRAIIFGSDLSGNYLIVVWPLLESPLRPHLLKMLFHSSNICNFIYFLHICFISWYITNSLSDQLPVGLIAQLVRALKQYRSGFIFSTMIFHLIKKCKNYVELPASECSPFPGYHMKLNCAFYLPFAFSWTHRFFSCLNQS